MSAVKKVLFPPRWRGGRLESVTEIVRTGLKRYAPMHSPFPLDIFKSASDTHWEALPQYQCAICKCNIRPSSSCTENVLFIIPAPYYNG